MTKTKLRNFTLEGEAMIVTAYLENGQPRYLVDFKTHTPDDPLTYEQLVAIRNALDHDASQYGGALYSLDGEYMHHPMLEEFQNTWGDEEYEKDVSPQGCDESGEAAQ